MSLVYTEWTTERERYLPIRLNKLLFPDRRTETKANAEPAETHWQSFPAGSFLYPKER
jgi:hypothetical protein